MNFEKLTIPAGTKFKNLNFWSLWKLGKTWKYSLSPRFRSSNFESIDELEHKMAKLRKAGKISDLTWWMVYFISSNFKNLSMNSVKYILRWEKWNFEPVGNFAHTTGFLTFGKALLIFLPLYIQMLIMQISTQANNQKYRKSVATKKSTL